MHVLFAHHEPIDPGKARWVAMLRTLDAVAARGRVTWFCADKEHRVRDYARDHLGMQLSSQLTIRTLPAVHKKMGLTLNSVFFRALCRALQSTPADVLWLRSDKLAAHVAHRNVGPPLVFEAHLVGELWAKDRGDPPARARRLHELEASIYGRAAGVAAITRGLVDEIVALFGYRGATAVVPSAVDTAVFKPCWKGGAANLVAYAGTLQFWKGLDTLLEALVLAPRLRLRLIGGSAEELAAMGSRLAEKGLAGRVELVGRVPQTRLPGLLQDVACACHPLPGSLHISARFTSPLKIFEYMGLGLPIVAADVPSIGEVLQNGVNALLYAPGDAAALAAALTRVCADQGLARGLAAAAAAGAVDYSYQRRAERLCELFARACVAPPVPPATSG